jgi:malonyl CoA-acyl carrier protein transacylase
VERLCREIDRQGYTVALGVDTVGEIGPERILAGLIQRIDRRGHLLNVGDPVSRGKTVAVRTFEGPIF